MKFVLVLVLLTCAMSLSLKERMQTATLERAEATGETSNKQRTVVRVLEGPENVMATAYVETSTNCPEGYESFCSGSDCACRPAESD